jgi:hypothetical protein
MPRYKMIDETPEGFGTRYFVIDTERRLPPGPDGHHFDGPLAVCFCFEEGAAMMIADALNKADL